jgi:hypothetical protein
VTTTGALVVEAFAQISLAPGHDEKDDDDDDDWVSDMRAPKGGRRTEVRAVRQRAGPATTVEPGLPAVTQAAGAGAAFRAQRLRDASPSMNHELRGLRRGPKRGTSPFR